MKSSIQKAVFLDRDGVLNKERGEYTYREEDFHILPGVPEALSVMHQKGYKLIVITNQAGIAKGLYTKEAVWACHRLLQEACGGVIDHLYFAPWHPSVSESLSRKPGTLMFERAMARYKINPIASFMVGDKERDLAPAKSLGIKTVSVSGTVGADIMVPGLKDLLAYLS